MAMRTNRRGFRQVRPKTKKEMASSKKTTLRKAARAEGTRHEQEFAYRKYFVGEDQHLGRKKFTHKKSVVRRGWRQ